MRDAPFLVALTYLHPLHPYLPHARPTLGTSAEIAARSSGFTNVANKPFSKIRNDSPIKRSNEYLIRALIDCYFLAIDDCVIHIILIYSYRKIKFRI